MSTQVSLIFPNQLYKQYPAIHNNRPAYLVEEWHFFNQYQFHKEKLVLHRSSMKFYEAFLKEQGIVVHYIESIETQNRIEILIEKLYSNNVKQIHIVDPVDSWLLAKIKSSCKKNGIELILYNCPNFLNSLNDVDAYFSKKKTYFQTDFYTSQRKSRNILIEKDGKPLGGKWTYDADNRSKFPKKEVVPKIPSATVNQFVKEAEKYVQKNYPKNYGSINKDHLFAINFIDTEKWLEEFLQDRFEKFGIYEDAIVAKETVLHHSVLSPMLNVGLISPQQIIDQAIAFSNKNNVPLNSLDLTSNTSLTSLFINDSNIANLDLSNNTLLSSLSLYYNLNPSLTSLDLSSNLSLTSFSLFRYFNSVNIIFALLCLKYDLKFLIAPVLEEKSSKP